MLSRILLVISISLIIYSCSKENTIYSPSDKIDPYTLYKEGIESFEKNDFFFASKKIF